MEQPARKYVVGGLVVAALAGAGYLVTRSRTASAPVVAAAAACPTARPLPPYAPPPASAYCTEKRYYVRACEVSNPPIYTRMWTTAPGYAGQICSAHTWAWADVDGFVYPIVDQGPTSTKYAKPPSSAPAALAEWSDCWINHHAPAGGYNCNDTPSAGTLIYHPVTLAQVPDPPRSSWATQYGCCGTPVPTPTPTIEVPPTFPPPPSITPGCPVCYTPTCGPKPVCTPKPVPTDLAHH